MGTLRCLAVLIGLCLPTAVAQATPLLQIDGMHLPCLDQVAQERHRAPPLRARAAADAVLGCLRLGDHESARRTLTACCERAADTRLPGEDAAWTAVALYWYLRASHDAPSVRRCLPALDAGLESMPDTAPRQSFANATIAAHGLLCRGGIEDLLRRLGGASERSEDAPREWTRLGIERWREVERQSWQPGRTHFRRRLTGDTLALPESPDPSVLLPAAAGMLIASDDRMQRHLRAVVHQALGGAHNLVAADFATADALALVLVAATQLGDDRARDSAWRALLAILRDEVVAPESAVRCLDAVLFAISGLRIATGVGVDEGWIRLRPWLPAACEHIVLRGLRAEGVTFDLAVARRRGDLQVDERGEEALTGAPTARLRVRLTLAATARGAMRFVLQGPDVQYVGSLGPGESFERSLPTADGS